MRMLITATDLVLVSVIRQGGANQVTIGEGMLLISRADLEGRGHWEHAPPPKRAWALLARGLVRSQMPKSVRT